MFDLFSFIISFFFLGVIVLMVWIGIKFFHSLVTAGQSNNNYSKETDRQVIEDSIEDSNGDGLFIADDDSEDLFPEEFDDDDY